MAKRAKARRRRKVKNFILKALAYINAFVFLVSASALDSESWLPFILCCITLAYLALFAYANNWFEEV